MDKLFDSYWVLRIIALVLAIALFFYVQSELSSSREASSGSTTETVVLENVPLEVFYDDENLIVTGLPETVNVTISGPAQIVLRTRLMNDFDVFVDLNSLMIGQHHVAIQHENFSDKLDVKINPGSINIQIEERVTQEFKVEPEMNGRLIDDAYILTGMVSEPASVIVTGAKSVVESISYVKATVDAKSGLKESFEQDANVKVLNSELNSLDVIVQPQKVRVAVSLEQYKRELPIKFIQTGEVQEGVQIGELKVAPEVIEVFGKKAVIDELEELVVEFDVSAIKESGKYKAKVTVPPSVEVDTEEVTIQATVTKMNAVNTDNAVTETNANE